MFGRASEEVVMVEVEIDYLTFAVNRKAGNVVTQIAIPADPLRVVAVVHVPPVAVLSGVRCLAWEFLFFAVRVYSNRTVIVTVPETNDECHQQQGVNSMAFLDGIFAQFRRQVHMLQGGDVFLPILSERIATVNTFRKRYFR